MGKKYKLYRFVRPDTAIRCSGKLLVKVVHRRVLGRRKKEERKENGY